MLNGKEYGKRTEKNIELQLVCFVYVSSVGKTVLSAVAFLSFVALAEVEAKVAADCQLVLPTLSLDSY